MSLPNGLIELARILAEWVRPAPGFSIYVFGSRVRGDQRPNSDVDVVIPIPHSPSEADFVWWSGVNEENFRSINATLPGPLRILENNDPIAEKVRNAREVHRDGQVRCVWMEPKHRLSA